MKYNIPQRYNIHAGIFSIFLLCSSACFSQQLQVSKYGVPVIRNVSVYAETVEKDSTKKMTNLQALIPDIVLDLRYATKNNFMKRAMYPTRTNKTFMRAPAAYALQQVQQELRSKGYGLKIFDAYRPYFVTEKFWELVHDDRYVADPKKGSGHNRGVAVDLTLIDLKTKQELKMPTGFDNFSDTAHHDFNSLPDDIIQNRALLKNIMEKHGFVPFATEWWHYTLPDATKYEVLDLTFEELGAK